MVGFFQARFLPVWEMFDYEQQRENVWLGGQKPEIFMRNRLQR